MDLAPRYLSWCRHLKANGLSKAARCFAGGSPVATAEKVPEVPRTPVVVPYKGCAVAWDMDFWQPRSLEMWWNCPQRSPAFEHDRRLIDVGGEPREYMEYTRLLEAADPNCLEEMLDVFAFRKLYLFSISYHLKAPLNCNLSGFL